jgi:uncharacterized protein (DUF2147 family)
MRQFFYLRIFPGGILSCTGRAVVRTEKGSQIFTFLRDPNRNVNGKYFSRKNGKYFSNKTANYFP